jgi:hypothetical protein
MKTDGEANCNGRKNTAVELTFMVKAFTQNVGVTGAYELPIAEKMLFSFSYTDQKLHLW